MSSDIMRQIMQDAIDTIKDFAEERKQKDQQIARLKASLVTAEHENFRLLYENAELRSQLAAALKKITP